jgi:hypothetical protein
MTTFNERLLAAADAEVSTWASLSAEDRKALASIEPIRGAAVLSWRGVDRPFANVPDAIDAAVRLGIPLDHVKVERFPMPSVVLAESPALRTP